ncbi:hypothetical protein, variant [Aphanomyces invadans]|nr:hypothetical protein, variant [Aphanomyces invadans]ETV98967.1 hypothetical protein, variant [Aphanomyces invadans]|eukprot:XP_008872394.1 hypothetical protein, variant [Aphanomyces invadans]
MKKFYNVEGEDDDDDDEAATVASKKPLTAAERRIAYLNKKARGELSGQSSSSSSEDSSDDDDDANVDEEEDEEEEDIPLGEETKRFAIMNCDWSRMRAVDLLALFQSFLPAAGIVHSVVVYPSDFGLARMAEEEKYGPRGLWADEKKTTEDGGSGSDTDDASEDDDDPLGVRATADADDGFDKEKLRQHELEKLKYYYAVATFNSVAAASAVFDACDGLEYETSSNTLDLRFVPDDVEFTNSPKETATSVPDTYTPAIFATLALQNTELECTWDEEDGERMDKLTRPANWKDLNDDDFSAYVAMSDDDNDGASDDDVEALKQKYRKALLGSDDDSADDMKKRKKKKGNKDKKANKAEDDDPFGDGEQGDMEMTFNDATDVLKAKQLREMEANETPFEKYQREKKHEKNIKKHDKRQAAKLAHEAQLASMKQAKKGKGKDRVARAGAADEDDDEDKRDFDMKFIAKLEKHKDKKGKHHKKQIDKLKAHATGLQEGFAFNPEDNRFSQLVSNNPDFSLDPTDSRFKRTEATEAIFETRRKLAKGAPTDVGTTLTDAAPATAEVNAIVENLKRKAATSNNTSNKKPTRF